MAEAAADSEVGRSGDLGDTQGLAERTRRMAAAVDNAHFAFIEMAIDGTVASLNPWGAEMFGWMAQEVVGRHVSVLSHSSEREEIDRLLAAVASGQKVPRQVARRRRKDGSVIEVGFQLSPIRDRSGTVTGISALMRDVGAEEQAKRQLEMSEALFRARFHETDIPQAVVALEGTIIEVNSSASALLGVPAEDLVGTVVADYLLPGEGQAVSPVEAMLAGQPVEPWERVLVRPDGTSVPVLVQGSVVRGRRRDESVLALFIQDLTLLKDAETRLSRNEAFHSALMKRAADWAVVLDQDARVVYSTPAFAARLGYEYGSKVGRPAGDLVHPDDREIALRLWERAVASDGPAGPEVVRLRSADGSWRWVETTFTDGLEDPGINGMVVNARDVTSWMETQQALRDAEQRSTSAALALRQRTLRDDLTPLGNRNLLTERLETVLGRPALPGRATAVIFIDLDRFKVINDCWGHETGDQLLIEAARRLIGIAPDDTVVRFGGDEFVVLLESTTAPEAEAVARLVLERLSEPYVASGRCLYASASIGVALSPPLDSADLLRLADAAMYEAKTAGRGRVHVFTPESAAELTRRLQLQIELRQAVESDGLDVHYQPLISIPDGRILGVEALVRWPAASGRVVSPDEFVAEAEALGLAPALDRGVLRRVVSDFAELDRILGPDAFADVNISASHLCEPAFDTEVVGVLAGGGVPAHRIGLEITESALMGDPGRARAVLTRLRREGIRVAIDDFGTGYSSLRYLHRLPATSLKIDCSFIAGVGNDPGALAIAASVIDLARNMGLRTVAEGIETAEQAEVLQQLGCSIGQGFLWSRALPLPELERFVSQRA
jgi:diguanylate cyclase (GGDEF)-like protein/PAS domain S-box-containing protein